MPFFSGSLNISGSIISTGVITSNGSPVITSNTTSSFVIDTGSFATTGSNTFIGNQTISGSVTSTGGFTGSLLGTATTSTTSSYALTAQTLLGSVVSASFATTASYIDPTFISASAAASGFGSGGGGSVTTGSNTFNGTQTISGSVIVTGSLIVSGSNTFTNVGPMKTGVAANVALNTSLAQGFNTSASGQYSHAEGYEVHAKSIGTHAEGYGSSAGLSAWDTNGTFDGLSQLPSSIGNVTSSLPPGTNVMLGTLPLVVSRSFFQANLTQVEYVGVPDLNLSSGNGLAIVDPFAIVSQITYPNQTKSVGQFSHAEGEYTLALLGHAEGNGTIAYYGHAEGGGTISRGYASHAEGGNTTSIGIGSHSEGSFTTASGDYSHAEGFYTLANGTGSHAEGYNTTASSDYSHAEGYLTKADGPSSHAEGRLSRSGLPAWQVQSTVGGVSQLPPFVGNITSSFTPGDYVILGNQSYVVSRSFFESNVTKIEYVNQPSLVGGGGVPLALVNNFTSWPNQTSTVGSYAHAEGLGNVAANNYTHAEGNGTKALGQYSHTEGGFTVAIGAYSHAEGFGTIAKGDFQHVGGLYNTEDSSSLFIIGNGDTDNTRKDAFKVRMSGSIVLPTTQSAAPSWTGTDGEMVFATVTGDHYFYVWMSGAWRSGSLA